MSALNDALKFYIEPGLGDVQISIIRWCFDCLGNIRGVRSVEVTESKGMPSKRLLCFKILNSIDSNNIVTGESKDVLDVLKNISKILQEASRKLEADCISQVLQICRTEEELGGLNIGSGSTPNDSQLEEIKFLLEAWLESLNSEENSKGLKAAISSAVEGCKPMNLTEKILAHHATSVPSSGGVTAGDLITITVDWIIASELSWTVGFVKF